jgi:hypothetical protein
MIALALMDGKTACEGIFAPIICGFSVKRKFQGLHMPSIL